MFHNNVNGLYIFIMNIILILKYDFRCKDKHFLKFWELS